jgi:hypothetical protein
MNKKNQPTEESLYILVQPQNSIAVSETIGLPRIPTISDMKLDGSLVKEDVEVIEKLSVIHPKSSFDNLTPTEARQLVAYSGVVSKMSEKEIWHIIKPYFQSIFNEILGDELSKMRDIEKRMNNKADYVPTMEWIIKICRRIIHARRDLFKYNIDFSAKAFDYRENPVDYLLMLMKAQKEFYPKRNTKLSEAFFSKIQLLIKAHAELMIKLKLKGQEGDDFYGSRYPKIRDNMRTLKALTYESLSGKPLTIKQQTLLINVIDEYKSSLGLIFTANYNDKALFDQELVRPIKNVSTAALEIYYSFDDSAVSSKGASFKNAVSLPSACELINAVYIKNADGKPLAFAYKNKISMIHLEEYIGNYFLLNQIDRVAEEERVLSDITQRFKPVYSKVVKLFFEILNKYI